MAINIWSPNPNVRLDPLKSEPSESSQRVEGSNLKEPSSGKETEGAVGHADEEVTVVQFKSLIAGTLSKKDLRFS